MIFRDFNFDSPMESNFKHKSPDYGPDIEDLHHRCNQQGLVIYDVQKQVENQDQAVRNLEKRGVVLAIVVTVVNLMLWAVAS